MRFCPKRKAPRIIRVKIAIKLVKKMFDCPYSTTIKQREKWKHPSTFTSQPPTPSHTPTGIQRILSNEEDNLKYLRLTLSIFNSQIQSLQKLKSPKGAFALQTQLKRQGRRPWRVSGPFHKRYGLTPESPLHPLANLRNSNKHQSNPARDIEKFLTPQESQKQPDGLKNILSAFRQ